MIEDASYACGYWRRKQDQKNWRQSGSEKAFGRPGVAGGSVTVITSLGGNVIVNVKDTRVAISEEMARKIMI